MRNRTMNIFFTALTGIALCGLVGCGKSSTDEAIAKDIEQKVAADPDAQGSQIKVEAKDGKVTLKGTAKSPAARQKAEQIAAAEVGTKTVDDQTVIQGDQAAMAQNAPAGASAPPVTMPPPPEPVVVPAGTDLTIVTSTALSSKDSKTGQSFMGSVAQPVSVGSNLAFPKGATVRGTVVTAKTKGKIKGEGELALALTSISVKGQTYRIHTNTLSSTIKGKGKRTAVTTGGGAAGGALIGGIAGGGKGAGIGALAGAGAGLIGGMFTGNKQIEIPAESPLAFTLSQPVTLPPPGSAPAQ